MLDPVQSLEYETGLLYNEFEKLIDKIDAISKELYLYGDVNCNFLPEAAAHISPLRTRILDIYALNLLFT